MDPNPPVPFDFGLLAGFGIVFFLIWLVVTALIVLLAIWIQYTIVWRAVRRGMREFHYGGKEGPQAIPPVQ